MATTIVVTKQLVVTKRCGALNKVVPPLTKEVSISSSGYEKVLGRKIGNQKK